ncbi:helix-turn-helix transcriptional regulator [Vibrio vulnificus]
MNLEVIYNKSFKSTPLLIEDTLIICGKDYCGEIEIDKNNLSIQENITVMVTSGSIIGFNLELTSENGKIYILKISNNTLQRIINRFDVFPKMSVSKRCDIQNNILVMELGDSISSLDMCEFLIKNDCSLDIKYVGMFNSAVSIFSEIFSSSESSMFWFSLVSDKSLKKKICHIIRENPQNDWTLSDFSKQLFLSQATIKRRLLKENTNFKSLVNNVRLGLAVNYLIFTNNSVNQISELCGFNSTTYFCTVFKKRFNMTPSSYRLTARIPN